MKFYLNRKKSACLGMLSLLFSLGVIFFSFHSFGFFAAIILVISLGFSFLNLFPVFKNQVVDIKDDHIVIYSFGKGYALRPEELYEVVYIGGSSLSYRFQKGDSLFQITPSAYYSGDIFEHKLTELFSKRLEKIAESSESLSR